jgi:hypothetical protein
LTGRLANLDSQDLGPVRRVMREAKSRRWKHLAEERIENVEPNLPLGRTFWALTRDERDELQELIEGTNLQGLLRRVLGAKTRRIVDCLTLHTGSRAVVPSDVCVTPCWLATISSALPHLLTDIALGTPQPRQQIKRSARIGREQSPAQMRTSGRPYRHLLVPAMIAS